MTAAEKWNDAEASREFASAEAQAATDDVLVAAWNSGALPDEARDLGPVEKLTVARWLLADASKRAGAWPTPEVAKLQRAVDALCRLDTEMDDADRQAVLAPIPLIIHARHEWHGEEARHPCGAPYVRGVTEEPSPSGVGPWGRYRSSPRPNCPGCRGALERHAELCAAVRR